MKKPVTESGRKAGEISKLGSPHLEKIQENAHSWNTACRETKLSTLIFQNSSDVKLMKENVV